MVKGTLVDYYIYLMLFYKINNISDILISKQLRWWQETLPTAIFLPFMLVLRSNIPDIIAFINE